MNPLSLFGLDSSDICCHSEGIDIAFQKMDGNIYNYFADKGFKLYKKNNYQVLSLKRKPKGGPLTSIKEAYSL